MTNNLFHIDKKIIILILKNICANVFVKLKEFFYENFKLLFCYSYCCLLFQVNMEELFMSLKQARGTKFIHSLIRLKDPFGFFFKKNFLYVPGDDILIIKRYLIIIIYFYKSVTISG